MHAIEKAHGSNTTVTDVSAESCGITRHATETPDKPALMLGRTRPRPTPSSTTAPTGWRGRFRRLGAGEDQVVAVVLPNCIEFFEVAAAAAKLEAPFLPVNWHLKGDELGYVLADSGARVVVTDPSLAPVVDVALAQAGECRKLVVGPDYEAALAEGRCASNGSRAARPRRSSSTRRARRPGPRA